MFSNQQSFLNGYNNTNNHNDNNDDNNNNINPILSLIDKYQSFLQKHRFSLHLAEDVISRFVLYAPSRFRNNSHHNHNNQEDVEGEESSSSSHNPRHHQNYMPETLYAFINLWSLINDALYYGLGNDNGLTVGTIRSNHNNCDTTNEDNNENNNMAKSRFWKTSNKKEQIIIILRSILSIIDCIAPALEVRAYNYQRQKRDSNNISNQKKYSNHAVLDVLTNIERIKFICRLAIVLLNYAINYDRQRQNPDIDVDNDMSYISAFGILKDGGLFELGCNDAISCENETKRVKRMLYVGKRTGRNIHYNQVLTNHRDNIHDMDKSDESNCSQSELYESAVQWGKSIMESPKTKIAFLVLGEFLHLLRPLYFIHASRHCEKLFTFRNDNMSQKQKRNYMLKTWIKSLLLDLISQKSIQLANSVRKKNILSSPNSSGGQQDDSKPMLDISSKGTKDELYHRKMRLMLYLLRSPMFDHVTLPVANAIGKVLNSIPLVGQPLTLYILDLLTYWQQWHFMMEK